ncbi:carbon-nitrogen hydrolase family protein [Vibrio sp. RC27]
MSKVGLIQMTSGPDVDVNINYIEQQVTTLAKQGVEWVLTPENSIVFGTKTDYHNVAEPLESNQYISRLATLAQSQNVWLIIGSMPILTVDNLVTTTTVVINNKGQIAEHYDKIHMFDVDVSDGHQRYRESETFTPGNEVKTVTTPYGCIGLSICYDVRFPHLYTELRRQQADIILVPAAFTAVTGKAHWEILLRARAIEAQCWIVAVNQAGTHQGGRETWGHSVVISPWGEVIIQAGSQAENVIAELDLNTLGSIRSAMPVEQHCRFSSQIIATRNHSGSC